MRDLNAKKVVVTMVDGTTFEGMLNISGSRRVSDYIKRSEHSFIVLFEAERNTGGQKDVYFLNMDHVLWIKPDDTIYMSPADEFAPAGAGERQG